MARPRTVFICQNCNFESFKWLGQCPNCKAWNSLVESEIESAPAGFRGKALVRDRKPPQLIKLSTVSALKYKRLDTTFKELNRVLGGGLVPGSVTLLAGAPGIGKSTLLTSVVAKLKGLYIIGEESPQQVKLRVDRLGLKIDFPVLPETEAELIAAAFKTQPLVVIDSIQTVWTSRLTGVAGSIGQVRESAQILLQSAKKQGVPIILVGHITKEGAVAGPKVLEHLVDTVLQFEGDTKHEYRLLRAVKNRFGPTDEVGVFALSDAGITEIANPSELFLTSRQECIPGSIIVCTMQGARPVLVEVQALVNPSDLSIPRRIASGIDQRRLQVLSAKDIFVNVAGGLRITEPAADLGICLAIASSYLNRPTKTQVVAIGEVGLLGEIRAVSFLKKRQKEAIVQGFKQIVTSSEALRIKTAIQLTLSK